MFHSTFIIYIFTYSIEAWAYVVSTYHMLLRDTNEMGGVCGTYERETRIV